MESSTGSNEDSSLCGLRDINLFINKYCNQNGSYTEKFGITEEHNSSEEIQGVVYDGNMRICANFHIHF